MADLTANKNATPYGEDFSMNQCSLMVRIDGQSLEVPLNFGMTSDEIRKLYPYILQFANEPLRNPAVDFGLDDKHGKYADLADDDLSKMMDQVNRQSRYWYGKSEASLLELAVRFALDIKLLGVQELIDIFMPVSPLEKLQHQDIEPLTDEEADRVVEDMGLETEVDHEYDPGDEQDVPLGVAGDLRLDLYTSPFENEYFSDELDRMESKLDVDDRFEKVIRGTIQQGESEGHYATNDRKLMRTDESNMDGSGAVLDMYGDEKSVFPDPEPLPESEGDKPIDLGEDPYGPDWESEDEDYDD